MTRPSKRDSNESRGVIVIIHMCKVFALICPSNAPDPNKMYEFKRDILNVLNVEIAT